MPRSKPQDYKGRFVVLGGTKWLKQWLAKKYFKLNDNEIWQIYQQHPNLPPLLSGECIVFKYNS